MEVINLNIIPGKAQPVVHTSQYDVGRVIRCNLFEGAEVFYLDGTETISCNIKKPDNNIVTLSVTNTTDSYVEITTTEQATACDGSNLCEISITKGDDVIGSLNFIMEVERSPIEGGISSASEINNLWTQVDGMVADILADSYDSADVIFDNLPTEGHGIPYTVTSEGIGNAIDNALDMTDTASGAIATFESEYALPLRDLEIDINAVQESGTPTPSSPKAISGFTGANVAVYNENLFTSMATSSNDGITTSYDNTTGLISIENNSRTTNYTTGSTRDHVATGLNSSHTYKYEIIPNIAGVILLGGGFTILSKDGFTGFTTADLRITKDYDFVNDHPIGSVTKVRLVLYDVTTGVLNTYPITWQSEAGTVYGGSLKIANGYTHLVDNKNYVDLGSLSWSDANGNLSSSSGIASDVKAPSANTEAFNGLCSCYAVAPRTGISDKQISVQTNGNIVISDTGIASMTGAQIKSYVTGFILVYEIATPVEYTLASTPPITTLQGTNNIFTDTNGDTSLEYYTKRGEQTVRISEGVAVDVINNKSIDTLATTDKTVKGAINELEAGIADTYTKTEVDTALALKFDNANRVTTGTGTFAGLLNTADRVWLITAQRLSTNSTIMLIAHKQNNNFYFKEIVKDAGMEYNYNSENGSVVITYGGSTTGVYGGAYRLA